MTVSPLTSPPSASATDLIEARHRAADRPSPEQVEKAARQFEAILVRQLLGPAIEPMMNGSSMGGSGGGSGGGVYGYMLTDTLATAMVAGGGLGLGDLFARQLGAPDENPAEARSL